MRRIPPEPLGSLARQYGNTIREFAAHDPSVQLAIVPNGHGAYNSKRHAEPCNSETLKLFPPYALKSSATHVFTIFLIASAF